MNLVLSAYCHCTRCQRLVGCPFVATLHLAPHVFSWSDAPPSSNASSTSGNHQNINRSSESKLDTYTISEAPHKTRYRCKDCGTPLASFNSAKDKWSVWTLTLDRRSESDGGGIIGWHWAKPTDHIFYDTRVLDVDDELGKWERYADESERVVGKLEQ